MAQEKNLHTTFGLGIGTTIPFGSFASHDVNDTKSAFAANARSTAKIIVEQNIGKRFGISLNAYSSYHNFDDRGFGQSLAIDHRGLGSPGNGYYEIHSTKAEWEVTLTQFGMYYYRNFGKKQKLSLRFIASFVITEMMTPGFQVQVKDSSGRLLNQFDYEAAPGFKEAFFLAPPFDGFSFEINGQYFFTKHFAIKPSLNFVNSYGYFDGEKKALINLDRVNFRAFNASVGLSYTIFWAKREGPTFSDRMDNLFKKVFPND